jgi:hypothetical protein
MKNRPERQISFLVVWLTMFSCISGYGQVFYKKGLKADFLNLSYPGGPVGQLYPNLPLYKSLLNFDLTTHEAGRSPVSDLAERNPFNGLKGQTGSTYIQPANLYYMQSGYFCKREWELEKATHIPFRFRLGSLADCNAMEGKH